MFLEIDFGSDLPIYEQIRRQIIPGLARGDLSLGQALPSVRQLGEDLGVNLHTVNKAYKGLQQDGFITMDRRFGTRISDEIRPMEDEELEVLGQDLAFIASYLKVKGIDKAHIKEYIDKIYGEGER